MKLYLKAINITRSYDFKLQNLVCRKKALCSFWILNKKVGLQWCALENQQNPFYVVNRVTLAGKKCIKNLTSPLN